LVPQSKQPMREGKQEQEYLHRLSHENGRLIG